MNATAPVAVDRLLWQELLSVLDEALVDGSRRALARLADREGTPADEALRELAAFPGRSCSALERGVALRPELCTARRGCPVVDECPLARGGPEQIPTTALASLVVLLVERWRRPLAVAPLGRMADLGPLVEQLVERSGRVGPASPPRSRTSAAVVALALRRGGPLGATGAFLTGPEVEQVAAFVPPGSGRDDPRLAPVEGWLRRAASAEVALVEPLPPRR